MHTLTDNNINNIPTLLVFGFILLHYDHVENENEQKHTFSA
jgi:hypothetical protein